MDGWIKLHRKLIDWEWYQDSKMVHLFIHLILIAQHQDTTYRGTELLRGQLITGRKKLSEQTGLSEQSIRTCLDRLKLTKEVTSKVTNKYSVLTVCNYELYNPSTDDINQLANQQSTSNQPHARKKEVKEVKASMVTGQDLMDHWNSFEGLPSVKLMTKKRKAQFDTRMKEPLFAEKWIGIVDAIAASDFCTGKTGKWKASLDWLLANDTNYVKVFEGKYENEQSQDSPKTVKLERNHLKEFWADYNAKHQG